MAIIDQFRSILTVLVQFEVPPEDSEKLLEEIKSFLQSEVKNHEGFISANLHLSLEKDQIVNYAQWRSKEDYEAFVEKTKESEKANFLKSYPPQTSFLKVALAT